MLIPRILFFWILSKGQAEVVAERLVMVMVVEVVVVLFGPGGCWFATVIAM